MNTFFVNSEVILGIGIIVWVMTFTSCYYLSQKDHYIWFPLFLFGSCLGATFIIGGLSKYMPNVVIV